MRKEIEVWVSLENIRDISIEPLEQNKRFYKKATLVIDIPEPKTEITKSELERVVKKNWVHDYIDSFTDEVWKDLFGEENE